MIVRAAAAAAVALFSLAVQAEATPPPAGWRSPATKAAPKAQAPAKPVSIPAYPGATALKMRTQFGAAQRRGNEKAVASGQAVLARSESFVYASKDDVAKLLAFYDEKLTAQGFARRSQMDVGTSGKIAAYARGTTSVSLQAYSDRSLWETYLADGEVAPPGTNGVFVVVTPGP